jgi:hypothetical protein
MVAHHVGSPGLHSQRIAERGVREPGAPGNTPRVIGLAPCHPAEGKGRRCAPPCPLGCSLERHQDCGSDRRCNRLRSWGLALHPCLPSWGSFAPPPGNVPQRRKEWRALPRPRALPGPPSAATAPGPGREWPAAREGSGSPRPGGGTACPAPSEPGRMARANPSPSMRLRLSNDVGHHPMHRLCGGSSPLSPSGSGRGSPRRGSLSGSLPRGVRCYPA